MEIEARDNTHKDEDGDAVAEGRHPTSVLSGPETHPVMQAVRRKDDWAPSRLAAQRSPVRSAQPHITL
jgi:hypothetical protein